MSALPMKQKKTILKKRFWPFDH